MRRMNRALVCFSLLCFDSYIRPIITMLTCFMPFHLCYYKLKEYHTWIKGELRGKNEAILHDWPIFSTSIFDNCFC